MNEKFSRLRFQEFAKAAAAGAIVGAMALQPVAASAKTGSVQINAGNANWFVNTNITFSTTSSGGLAMSSASLHTISGTRDDAFDGAFSWHVNAGSPGSLFEGEYRSPGGTVSVTANSVIGTTQPLAGLNVHAELFFASAKAVARSLLVLQNPTGAPITVTVDNDSNLGSDNNTTIHATSSGDATFDSTDNWFVSCQRDVNISTNCVSDPVLTVAFQGPAGVVRGTNISGFTNGSNNFNERWTVTVPAGGTQSLMTFVQLSATPEGAQADAAAFNNTGSLQAAGYLAGLSPIQESQIVNWNISAAAAPTLSEWAVMAMGSLLALVGLGRMGFFRRRRSAGAS
jgi:hypothetical protein